MNTSTLNNIIKRYDLEDIEKSLILRYAQINDIDLSASPFLWNYVSTFSCPQTLYDDVCALSNFSLEDLSVAFELLIPDADRIVNGAFFTPSYIVDYIIRSVSPSINETIADISCGCGAFLLGILKYYMDKFSLSIKSILQNNLFGADILDYNVRRSKILIALFALNHNEIIEDFDLNIICCDSLRHDWKRNFDCIVGNPPYVKFQDMTDDVRHYLSQEWSTTSFGTFNLYFAFFELGHKLLSETGRLGYITPNNYFTSLAGESMRSYFQRHQCVYRIADFSATKVFDVQAYTAITFVNNKKNDSIDYGKIDDAQTAIDFLDNFKSSPNYYNDLNPKKWRLLCDEEKFIIRQIESVGEPIGNLFNICVGIATLKDDVYSFFPCESDEKYYYFKRDSITWQVEKELTRTTVKISDMKCQTDILKNDRHFIFPYKYVKGKVMSISEDEMQQMYPYCYKYFVHVKDVLATRGKGKHSYSPFYSYGRTQGLNRKGVKIYTPTFSKFPRFLIDFDEFSLFTNGYGIYFRETESSNLFDYNRLSRVENLDVIQKILNSQIMHYYITATSVAIEGGYPCYQKNFIEKFSIPYLDDSQIRDIRNISDERVLNAYLANLYHINLPVPNLCS